MHTHVMTNADQDKAYELKNEFLDLCLQRKANTLVALAAARCAAECFESIINEQHGEVFTVDTATPPTTPSDAAMRAAEEAVELLKPGYPMRAKKVYAETVAAIITRHLPVPAAAPDPGTLYWTKDADGYPILDAVTAAATTSPETPVGGETHKS